ncbi:UNVERIFIED_CONTAM: hypothetical protein FKN15_027672 [Acipenser sinensis]
MPGSDPERRAQNLLEQLQRQDQSEPESEELALQADGDRLPPGHTVSQLETCKIRSIKAGTLERLVETLLTAFGDNDFTYISIFLSTYRAFASPADVLGLLLDSAIASILRAWLDQCPEDFHQPPEYPSLHKVLEYLHRTMPGSDPERRAQNLLEQLQRQDQSEPESEGGFHGNSSFCLGEDEEVEECRIRKNFSSLRAIISALQSNPIYRLKRTWASVPK